jgi:hypothetical protein
MRRRSSQAVALTVVPLLAASFLAGCGDDEETAYCVDENDEVVENRYCDDEYDGITPGGAFFWYFVGSSVGNVTRGTKLSGGERISAADRAALARRGGFGASNTRRGAVGKAVSGGGGRSGGG